MKASNCISRATLICLAAACAPLYAAPESLPEGAEFGSTAKYLKPIGENLYLSTYYGPLYLHSGAAESTRGSYDGGLHLSGKPIRFYLGSADVSEGNFEIYRGDSTVELEDPLFVLNSSTHQAEFNGVDLKINGGTLSVAGSPVATQLSMPVFLEGLSGKIDIGNGSAGTNAIAIGVQSPTASGNGAVALGSGTASGTNAFASGSGALSQGIGSVAIGTNTTASGWYSVCLGSGYARAAYSFAASQGGVTVYGVGASALSGGLAEATHAIAAGQGTSARQYSAVAVGMHNLDVYGGSTNAWLGNDPIFTVGNGSSYSELSDALKMLKNGQTTLINKKWNSAQPLADPDPVDTTDAAGEALVVKGHARLQGKVTIEQRQGDILMGDFGL